MASATMLVLVLVFTVVMTVESANHSAPAPAENCSTVMGNLVDCSSFVTNDMVKKPEGSCCSGLKTILKTNPECLCETFKNSTQFGDTLNVTRALSLPAACHLKAPSFRNNCGSLYGLNVTVTLENQGNYTVEAGFESSGGTTQHIIRPRDSLTVQFPPHQPKFSFSKTGIVKLKVDFGRSACYYYYYTGNSAYIPGNQCPNYCSFDDVKANWFCHLHRP